MHQPGPASRPRQAETSSLHDGPRGASAAPYGWAYLAGYGGALDEATRALPVVAPLLTRGQRWRADHAVGGTEPRR